MICKGGWPHRGTVCCAILFFFFQWEESCKKVWTGKKASLEVQLTFWWQAKTSVMIGACPKLVSLCKVLCPYVLWHVVRKFLLCHFLGVMIQSIFLYLAHSMISVRAEVNCVPNSPLLPTCYLFQSLTLNNFCISVNIGTIMYRQTNNIIFSWEYIFFWHQV